MSIKSVRFILSSACLLGLWLPSRVAARAKPVAPPRRGLTSVRLGMPRAEVWKRGGKPNEAESLRFAGRFYAKDHWEGTPETAEGTSEKADVTYRQGKVIQIRLRAAENDSSVGTYLSIRRRHPHLKAVIYNIDGDVGFRLIVDDVRRGIAWETFLDHDDALKVRYLPELRPTWVITHRPGQAALPASEGGAMQDDPYEGDFRAIRAWFAVGVSQDRRKH